VLAFDVFFFASHATATDAVITDKTGAKATVSNLKSHRHDECGSPFLINVFGGSTETDFYYDFLEVNMGEYEVRIPFEIIKAVTVHKMTDPEKTQSEQNIYAVLLSDGTEIKGVPTRVNEFVASTDLGEFTISTGGVKDIVFPKQPSLSFSASPCGENSATLVLLDGSQLRVNGAAIMCEKKNRNGCHAGEEYLQSFKFNVGESQYDIAWGKISSIVLSVSGNIKLIAKTGIELDGAAQNVLGVQGIAKIGKFTLRVTVPFDSKASKIIF